MLGATCHKQQGSEALPTGDMGHVEVLAVLARLHRVATAGQATALFTHNMLF